MVRKQQPKPTREEWDEQKKAGKETKTVDKKTREKKVFNYKI